MFCSAGVCLAVERRRSPPSIAVVEVPTLPEPGSCAGEAPTYASPEPCRRRNDAQRPGRGDTARGQAAKPGVMTVQFRRREDRDLVANIGGLSTSTSGRRAGSPGFGGEEDRLMMAQLIV